MVESHILLLIGIVFLLTFVFGRIFERIHIPGIFVALLLGVATSFLPVVKESIQYDGFKILSFLAMNFLLFLIGFEIDIGQIKKLGKFIFRSSFVIILSEAITLGLLIYFIFHLPIVVSALIGLSFATVGEAILIPILDSLKITKTNLGQSILGVATMDDIFEVFSVVLVVAFLPMIIGDSGLGTTSMSSIFFPLIILVSIVLLGFLVVFLMKKYSKHKALIINSEIAFSMVLFFLFVGFGSLADLSAIGAIVGGVVANEILNSKDRKVVEHYVKDVAYYLLGPIFFFSIGAKIDLSVLVRDLPLVLLFCTVPYIIKIIVSYLNGKNVIGKYQSIYMGMALGVRFSTSIVILTLFLGKGIIGEDLFSILISTTIMLVFIPIFLSFFAKKFNLVELEKKKNKKK